MDKNYKFFAQVGLHKAKEHNFKTFKSSRIFPPEFLSQLFFQKEFLPISFPLEIISINIKIFLNISVQSFGGKEALVPRPAEYISGSCRFRIFYSYLMIFYKSSVFFHFFSTYLTTFIEV